MLVGGKRYKCCFWFYDVHSVLKALLVLLVVTVSYELYIEFIVEIKYKHRDHYKNENQRFSIFKILSIF